MIRGCHAEDPGGRRRLVHVGGGAKRRARRWALLLMLAPLYSLCLGGCSHQSEVAQPKLPAPIESTTLGPGDVFQLQIVGEKELPDEYQVAPDGTVDIPYIHRTPISGLEPQEVARLVRQRLIERQILKDPSVVVTVKEYASKRVTLLGQIQKPGSLPLSSGLTLLQAISMSGGFTAIAKSASVRLTRKMNGSTLTVVVDVDAITDGRTPDIPLQAGDSIFVQERVF